MGLPVYRYSDGDDTKYPVIEITSKDRWIPLRYRQAVRDHFTDNISVDTLSLDHPNSITKTLPPKDDTISLAQTVSVTPKDMDFCHGQV